MFGVDKLNGYMNYIEKYVVVNIERGMVAWCENYKAALRRQEEAGGIVLNTEKAPHWVTEKMVTEARSVDDLNVDLNLNLNDNLDLKIGRIYDTRS